MKLALSMGNADGSLIELCDRDGSNDFARSPTRRVQNLGRLAVADVTLARLQRSKEDLERDRKRDSDIVTLKQKVAQLRVQTSTAPYQASPRSSPTASYVNPAPGTAASMTPQVITPSSASPLPGTPQSRNLVPDRDSPALRAPLSQAGWDANHHVNEDLNNVTVQAPSTTVPASVSTPPGYQPPAPFSDSPILVLAVLGCVDCHLVLFALRLCSVHVNMVRLACPQVPDSHTQSLSYRQFPVPLHQLSVTCMVNMLLLHSDRTRLGTEEQRQQQASED